MADERVSDRIDERFQDRISARLKRALQLLCLGSLAATLTLGSWHLRRTQAQEDERRDELQRVTHAAAAQIDGIVMPVSVAAAALAGKLTRAEGSAEAVEAELARLSASSENIFGGTVAYAPYAHDPKVRLYAPYFKRVSPGRAVRKPLEKEYDYTVADTGADSKTDWYVLPMREGGKDSWSPPYFDPALKSSMITYSAVFMAPGTKPVKNGVVTIDVSMDQLKRIIRALDLGPGGFGALTTGEGVYLYHPDERLVRERRTLEAVAREKRDPDRFKLAAAAPARASGVMAHRSTTTGERSWLAYAPVPSTGWSLQITFVRNDLPPDVEAIRHRLVWLTIAVIGFLGSLALLLLRAHGGRTARLWAGTAAVSALLVGGIGSVWYLALSHHAIAHDHGRADSRQPDIAITDRVVLATLQDEFGQQRSKKMQDPPVYIPTGIHIESLQLDGANTLSVTGQIWQRYPGSLPAGSPRGVLIGSAKDVKFTPIDTPPQPDAEGRVLHRWSFQFNLRTEFNFSRYPLEIEQVGIALGPIERGGRQALVPDLDAYNIALASQRPGLAADVFIPGWKIESTSFVLRPRNENTRFGLDASVDLENFPDLHYEIGVERVFVDAFISNLTPLIVVAIVLFSLLLLPPSMGIKDILGICVSLFFVVVYSHLSIRRTLASGQIFYLEYFFLVIYVALLAVPINAFRRALEVPNRVLEYREGLVMKVLYWPVMLGTFLVITVVKFY